MDQCDMRVVKCHQLTMAAKNVNNFDDMIPEEVETYDWVMFKISFFQYSGFNISYTDMHFTGDH